MRRSACIPIELIIVIAVIIGLVATVAFSTVHADVHQQPRAESVATPVSPLNLQEGPYASLFRTYIATDPTTGQRFLIVAASNSVSVQPLAAPEKEMK